MANINIIRLISYCVGGRNPKFLPISFSTSTKTTDIIITLISGGRVPKSPPPSPSMQKPTAIVKPSIRRDNASSEFVWTIFENLVIRLCLLEGLQRLVIERVNRPFTDFLRISISAWVELCRKLLSINLNTTNGYII